MEETQNKEVEYLGNWGERNTQSKSTYSPDGLCPTLQAAMGTGGNTMPFIVDIKKPATTIFAYDEQNNTIRKETIGTLTTDGSSPKHNNRVVEIEEIQVIGQMDNSEDHTFESCNRVYGGGGSQPNTSGRCQHSTKNFGNKGGGQNGKIDSFEPYGR